MDPAVITEVTQLIYRYGHVADAQDLEGLADVFAPDAVFDQTAVGGKRLEGLDAIRAFFSLSAGPDRPMHSPIHHATNVCVFEDDGAVHVHSKFLTVDPPTGLFRSGDYTDVVVRREDGWRIAQRTVMLRWRGPA
jgi:uncharacterized protein (TIGR02246 family)